MDLKNTPLKRSQNAEQLRQLSMQSGAQVPAVRAEATTASAASLLLPEVNSLYTQEAAPFVGPSMYAASQP